MNQVKKLFLTGIFAGLTIDSSAPAEWEVGHEFTDFTGNRIRIVEIICDRSLSDCADTPA